MHAVDDDLAMLANERISLTDNNGPISLKKLSSTLKGQSLGLLCVDFFRDGDRIAYREGIEKLLIN